MGLEEWFAEFMDAHMSRFAYYPWPLKGSDAMDSLLDGWHRLFILNGLRREVADESSIRLMGEETSWERHLPRLIQLSHEVSREMNASGKLAEPDSREAAAAASIGCPDCAGQGLTTRYRHRATGDGKGRNAVGFVLSCYCLCPMGRWIASTHRAKSPELKHGIADLATLGPLQLRRIGDGTLDNPHRYPVDAWDALHDRPMPPTDRHAQDVTARGLTTSVRDVLTQRPALPSPGVPDARNAPSVVPVF